jgi:hypothetical protein
MKHKDLSAASLIIAVELISLSVKTKSSSRAFRLGMHLPSTPRGLYE